MPMSELAYKSADGTKIVAYRWEPENAAPRAAAQLTHGMGEHARRYDHVARALNDAGFVVYAQDHRGHGASGDPDAYGDLGTRRLADPAQLAAMRSDLPLYIAAGEADPVNGGLALLTPLTDRYQAAGLTALTIRTYPGARHEILNETNRAEVIAALNSWLDRVVPSAGRDA